MAPRLSFDETEDASPQSIRQYHDHWRRLLDLEWAEEERCLGPRLLALPDPSPTLSLAGLHAPHDPCRSVPHAPHGPCRSVTERLESWPVARLEREGLCLTGLRHRSTGRYYDRLLLRFGFGAESRSHAAAPRAEREQSRRRHEFEVGDAVVMARQKDGGQALKGELVELSADAVAVAVSEAHTHAVDRHGDA